MKRIEDIKEFKDIDTYYEISKIVEEVFQDRVEAHKHLVTANKEIERLNNIINELEKDINKRIERYDVDETINGIVTGTLKYVLNKLQELKGSSNNE